MLFRIVGLKDYADEYNEYEQPQESECGGDDYYGDDDDDDDDAEEESDDDADDDEEGDNEEDNSLGLHRNGV